LKNALRNFITVIVNDSGNSVDSQHLFGTSGIRGIVNQDLTLKLCERVGKALGTILKPHSKICLATDTRQSRDLIRESICSGLLSTGVNITNLGILPTPALALLTREMGFDTGIMLTASHNPPEYNGIKLFNKDTTGYSTTQEKVIEKLYFKGGFRKGKGILNKGNNMQRNYFSFIKKKLTPNRCNRDLVLVIDPGNGAAAGFASDIFTWMGCNILTLNNEPDGLFPGRKPEPKADTLEVTIEFLRQQSADLAICFDGDADRVVFCDKEGFLGFDEALAFISMLRVRETGKKKVATTVESGKLLEFALNEVGGELIRGKVGDVNVAYLTKENDAALGIEGVGVYIFPELGYYPDSIFASLYLVSNLEYPGQIREYIQSLPSLSFEKTSLPCPNEAKSSVMLQLKAISPSDMTLTDQQPLKNITDGLRLEYSDSWMLIRPSGTEPIIRIIAESTSKWQTAKLIAEGEKLVGHILSSFVMK
jgi:phosphoglucosamine mutase